MEDQSKRLNLLLEKLDLLLQRQATFQDELDAVKEEIAQLQFEEELVPELPPKKQILESKELPSIKKPKPVFVPKFQPPQPVKPKKSLLDRFGSNAEIEKFLGENLASKIGIIITVLGVGIGAKYAIDHQLISPLTRIILGYFAGIMLLGFSLKLKAKYETFSAVLLSGAMSILYFITYFGYDLYDLIPQEIAFGMMVLFTAFTVFAALKFDQKIIAGLGLVGAYGVPFLLSNNSGNILFLLSYLTLINIGILVISFRKNWKSIFNLAFYLTWLIFLFWWIFDYSTKNHFEIALGFSTAFFCIFYVTFLAYRIQKNQPLKLGGVLLLLLNSMIYFGIGYGTLDDHSIGKEFLGAFSIFNGFLHFLVCRYVFQRKLGDENIFYFVAGLVLIFITMAVPIQLDGSWVTLIWVAEAALLFWIGRAKTMPFYEKLSFGLMLLAGISLLEDWDKWSPNFYYHSSALENQVIPFINQHFLTGIVFLLIFGFIQKIAIDKKYLNPFAENRPLFNLHQYLIPTILVVVAHNTFWIEIGTYFENAYLNSAIIKSNDNLYPTLDESILLFKDIWLLNFSLFFLAMLTFLNIKKIQNQVAGQINLFLNLIGLLFFLVSGLFILSEIREIYLANTQGEFYHRGMEFQLIRYISLLIAGLLGYASLKLTKAKFVDLNYPKVFEVGIYLVLAWILSSELLHWMDVFDAKNSYKFALSILWGCIALLGIWVGISRKKQHIRMTSIVLFGLTLVKLFFYDIAEMETIPKTIVLVSLGVLLLIMSFLYNKFKDVLFDEDK